MSGVDISDLKKEKLSEGKFPVQPKSDFRFHMTEAVHKNIQEHAKADKSVEICGVLVGKWEKDENGPYAVASENIRCDSATSKFAEVTFTHESWSQINKEMDSKYSDLRIIGWYHSHPDFGIFLSDRDVFIHENFFSGAGQVAYVVDPVRDLEGVFTWKEGKPEPISHYWIGDRIRTVDAVTRSTAPPRDHLAPTQVAGAANPQASQEEPRMLPFLTTFLAWLALFLLGYLFAGLRTYPDPKLLEQGAVARYGITKFMKPNFEQNMTLLRNKLVEIHNQFQELPAPNEELSEEELEAATKSRKEIANGLRTSVDGLDKMKDLYGLSDAEREAVALLVAEELIKLQGAKIKKRDSAEEKTKQGPSPKTARTEAAKKTEKTSASEKPKPKTEKPETQPAAKATDETENPAKAEK